MKHLKVQLSSFVFVLLFSLLTSPIQGQKFKKVLGKPLKFLTPVDNAEYYLSSIKKKEKDVAWIVICDRITLKTHEEPNENSPNLKTVKFKDWFYVVAEKDDWIQLAKANLKSGIKIEGEVNNFGWVHKKNMLLWTSGIIDSKTKIHKKAFLLNKKKEIDEIIRLQKKEIVKIYKGPNTKETIGEKTIYEFYFIMKKENDRYLLSKEVRLSPNHNMKQNLLGWVSERRVEDWNTRICLEPNFDPAAFKERKDKDQFRVRGYTGITYADGLAAKGDVQEAEVEWDRDPVILNPSKLAKTDPYRYKGQVVRFPMLNNTEFNFRSGVIGDIAIGSLGDELEKINEINYSGIVNKVKKSETSRDNYNIFFLIEGTPSMKGYQGAIVDAVKKMSLEFSDIPNVKFGAAVYRDGLETQEKRIFDVFPLKERDKIEEVASYIQNLEFKRWEDHDGYTSMLYGLNQALLEGGFNDNYTNIVYVLGSNGDYSGNMIRRRKAMKDGDKTLITDMDPIIEKLGKLNIHLIGIQCRRDDGKRTSLFTDQIQELVLESSKEQYNLFKGVVEYVPDITLMGENNITLNFSSEENMYRLRGGANKGFITMPNDGGTLGTDLLTSKVITSGKEINQYVADFWTEMNKVFEDGASMSGVSSGPLAPNVAKELFKLLEANKNNGEAGWNNEDLQKLAKNKYQLYSEIYIPKQINGAQYPTCSYVLFMPESDLDQYLKTIESIEYTIMQKSTNELRKELYNMFLDLLEYYTGNSNRNELKKLSTDDLRAFMQGIDKEGFNITQEHDFKILNIMNKRKMSDDEVRNYADRILENAGKLKRIKNKGKNYEFSYSPGGGNTYFWIPLDWTF